MIFQWLQVKCPENENDCVHDLIVNRDNNLEVNY